MIDRVVAGSRAARPPKWRLVLTAVLAAGAAFGFAGIVFTAVVGAQAMDTLAALLSQPWPVFLAVVFLLLAVWQGYMEFHIRLNSLLRWLLAIVLGAGFAGVMYVWAFQAPFSAMVAPMAIFTLLIAGTTAWLAPKRDAATNAASEKEKSHG